MSWRWWEQEHLDLEGDKEIATAELDREEALCGEVAAQEQTPDRDWIWGILR